MEWLKRLGAAIDYIEENLDKEISYDEAAHIACCSTYYFQRIFSYVSGVSLSEYIRRRKMTQAAFELQRTDNKVIDVAHKYGYSSPTSFNRAFQSVHGIAPIAAKSMGCTLCAYPSIQFSIIVLGGSAMAYHIEEKKSIRIIGIRIPLVEDAEENMRNVPAFWKKAVLDGSISKLAELSNKNPDGNLGQSVHQAFNTCISFLVNCNLQHYSGESGLSYLTQLFVIMLFQFITAATGMAAMAGIMKALAAKTTKTIGNFWYFL
ncbi:MAG: potassium-transporting ATPase subunit KdpA, partial [Ruminococcus bromii]